MRINLEGESTPGQIEGLLAKVLRLPDVLAVYAPGELEALLVEATPEQSAEVATRLGTRFEAAGVRVQLGLACFPRDAASPGDLLALANRRVRRPQTADDGVDDRSQDVDDRSQDVDRVESPAMRQLRGLIAQVAPGHISVLILGETGVGKEIVAERLHQQSPRASKTFLRLNCAALSETLLESELFGHERGAFTGAIAAKPGLIETADGGTVFLDEVGELPMSTQVKLLRVLDEKKVTRVGALTPRAVDVRFVAATNRDLEQAIVGGRFRQDLYYRLAAVLLQIPPLRERVGEIAPLAQHFVRAAAKGMGMKRPPDIATATRGVLEHYSWPGNVRELRNVIERAVLLCGGETIQPRHLPMDKLEAVLRPTALSLRPRSGATPTSGEWDEPMVTGRMPFVPDDLATQEAPPPPSAQLAVAAPPRPQASPVGLHEEVKELEKARILDALASSGGNQSAAARQLGMSRGALIARLEEWGVARPRKGR